MTLLSDYCTVAEVSAATGLKHKTLLKRIARGKIETKKLGRINLIPRTEVERLQKQKG